MGTKKNDALKNWKEMEMMKVFYTMVSGTFYNWLNLNVFFIVIILFFKTLGWALDFINIDFPFFTRYWIKID